PENPGCAATKGGSNFCGLAAASHGINTTTACFLVSDPGDLCSSFETNAPDTSTRRNYLMTVAACRRLLAFSVRIGVAMQTAADTPPEVVSEPRIGRSVSLDHAAQMLGVSRRTIYNRIRDGRLQTIRTPGGSQRVLLDSAQVVRGPATPERPGRPSF